MSASGLRSSGRRSPPRALCPAGSHGEGAKTGYSNGLFSFLPSSRSTALGALSAAPLIASAPSVGDGAGGAGGCGPGDLVTGRGGAGGNGGTDGVGAAGCVAIIGDVAVGVGAAPGVCTVSTTPAVPRFMVAMNAVLSSQYTGRSQSWMSVMRATMSKAKSPLSTSARTAVAMSPRWNIFFPRPAATTHTVAPRTVGASVDFGSTVMVPSAASGGGADRMPPSCTKSTIGVSDDVRWALNDR